MSLPTRQRVAVVLPELLGPMLAGAALTGSLIVAMGPQNLHVLRVGLSRRHVLLTVMLCVAVDALLIAAALGGASLALIAQPGVAALLPRLAALLLLWMAWRMWRDAAAGAAAAACGAGTAAGRRGALLQAALVSLGNPAVWLETLLVVGAAGATLAAPDRLAFGAGALAASTAWFCGLGYGARWAGRWLARPAVTRGLGLAGALMLALMALQLGVAGLPELPGPLPVAAVSAAAG
jgi:L-lysine exporter family protein LysE/ArgO